MGTIKEEDSHDAFLFLLCISLKKKIKETKLVILG